jgi:hypothetical protein
MNLKEALKGLFIILLWGAVAFVVIYLTGV